MDNRLTVLFDSLQNQLRTKLGCNRIITDHPGAMGEASEENWIDLFSTHLPNRYQASKAFVIDSRGNCSDQIDIVIFDRHFTPYLYNRDGQRFLPAESVYAVFEVKQSLNREHVIYAGQKAASVRCLSRTSAPIIHAGGQIAPRQLFPIIAGILTYTSDWHPPIGDPFFQVLHERSEQERIDIGCIASSGGFEINYSTEQLEIVSENEDKALIFFFFRLLDRLQRLGTVPAIDYSVYNRVLRAGCNS